MATAGAPAQWRGVLLQNFIENSTSLLMRVEVLIQELENFSSCLYFACNTNACTQLIFFGASVSTELSAAVQNVKLNLTLWSENTLCL